MTRDSVPPQADNPNRRPPLLVVGLTGGIAAGKSTVAEMFRKLGAVVINADLEGRAVVEPGEPALAEVVREFGPSTLLPDGSLNRRAVAEQIFGHPAARRCLNRITHPRIAEKITKKVRKLATQRPAPPVVILEAALLIEAGWAPLVDKIVVVVAQHSTQVARLIARDGFSAEEAEARIRAQLPPRQRLRWADFRISSEVTQSETRDQVAAVWDQLVRQPRRG